MYLILLSPFFLFSSRSQWFSAGHSDTLPDHCFHTRYNVSFLKNVFIYLFKFVTISVCPLGGSTVYHYYIAFISFHFSFFHFSICIYFIMLYIMYLFCTLDGTGPLQWPGGPSSKPGKPKGKKKCSSRQKFDVRLHSYSSLQRLYFSIERLLFWICQNLNNCTANWIF